VKQTVGFSQDMEGGGRGLIQAVTLLPFLSVVDRHKKYPQIFHAFAHFLQAAAEVVL